MKSIKVKDIIRKVNKITFNPFGGGVLFLICLCLTSGGFASWIIGGGGSLLQSVNGQINIGNVYTFISLNKTEYENGYRCFTVCQDGLINEPGIVSNYGEVVYYLSVDSNAASSFITNNSISVIFTLSNNSGYFINSNNKHFDISYGINYPSTYISVEDSNYLTYCSIVTNQVDLNIQQSLTFSIHFKFNYTGTDFKTFFNTLPGEGAVTPNFSLLIEGVRN